MKRLKVEGCRRRSAGGMIEHRRSLFGTTKYTKYTKRGKRERAEGIPARVSVRVGRCRSVSVRVGRFRFTRQPREEGFCRPVGAWRIWVSGCRGMNPPAKICRPVGAEHIRVFPTSPEGAEENSPGWNPHRGCSPGNCARYHIFKPRRGGRGIPFSRCGFGASRFAGSRRAVSVRVRSYIRVSHQLPRFAHPALNLKL